VSSVLSFFPLLPLALSFAPLQSALKWPHNANSPQKFPITAVIHPQFSVDHIDNSMVSWEAMKVLIPIYPTPPAPCHRVAR
jgi:hypothetical protein